MSEENQDQDAPSRDHCCFCGQRLSGIAEDLYKQDYAYMDACDRGDTTVAKPRFPDPNNREAWYALAAAHARPGADPEDPLCEWVDSSRGNFWEDWEYFSVSIELSPQVGLDLRRLLLDPEEFVKNLIWDALQKLRGQDVEAR